jgi:hypothetical protein
MRMINWQSSMQRWFLDGKAISQVLQGCVMFPGRDPALLHPVFTGTHAALRCISAFHWLLPLCERGAAVVTRIPLIHITLKYRTFERASA